MDGVHFDMISEEENRSLIAPFSLREIEVVVKESDGNKSPGPDGFNFAFFKEFWYLLKHEIRIMFDQFHANEVLPKSFLSYFVALIPKVQVPLSLKEYRPISLLGSLYKFLSKVLAARLSKVMNSIIFGSQSAFLKGRHLVDGVLVVNEVVDLAKRSKRECLIFKVDFEKAYDSVDWGFLEYMMRRVGLCDKWVRWMKACVFGGKMSILVNGCPTEEISVQKGLKQGDPLAAFLFLLVAEGFSGLMTNAVNRNLFHGFEIKRGGLTISHLQYADDTLCIGVPTVENLWTLKAMLRGFEMASGLKVNFHKSSLIGVNVPRDFMEAACRFLHCREGSIPFVYLGLPVGANPKKFSTLEPMLVKLRNRLNSWGSKYVSLGGRIVLLNSVLNAIPIFYLSYLKIPERVVKEVIRIQRNFLWGEVRGGRKICWVNWKRVCSPRSKGGLGVRDVRLVNLSLMAKWKWRILQEEMPLWKVVLRDKYGDSFATPITVEGFRWPRFSSIWWKDLSKLEGSIAGNWFSDWAVRRVSNGRGTSFWQDKWIGDHPLAITFPRLFNISLFKEAKIGDMCDSIDGEITWNFGWRREPFIWEQNLIDNLLALLEDFTLGADMDKWWWTPDDGGNFSVNSSYRVLEGIVLLDDGLNDLEERVFGDLWKSSAPSKVIAFSWMTLLDRIPTRSNLALRRVLTQEDPPLCVMCGLGEETTSHLFLHCDVAWLFWRLVFDWLGINFMTPQNLYMHFACWSDEVNSRRIRKAFWLIWHSAIWTMWRERNARIFKNQFKHVDELVDEVKALSWCWALSRLRIASCFFYEWCWNPRDCLLRRGGLALRG